MIDNDDGDGDDDDNDNDPSVDNRCQWQSKNKSTSLDNN